ncbi:MAG TPA: medium chain dehydrogenase/reductase family protein [Steroidobacteraceae bacterium]|jgi:NADPH:quinone reductase-like Zn-dependent oxidoreductase|nr:medium chain dehydrogenase/reductase family protein [Steroidobacteraceae bacterium]
MRQIYITGYGGAEKLQVREAPDPQPQSNAVRIRVRASGINFADILARQGLYPDAPKAPCVVGYEVSGRVDAAGPAARQDWIGRDVFALTRFGGYADMVVVPEAQVFEKPASLSYEQCAAIPVNYLTVWQLLVVMGSLSADETVMIHNAGGGVGLAAIDVARHIGSRIFGTASGGKHAFLKERGLHEAIDYRSKDWPTELSRLTDGRGVELIIDPIGGSHWKKSYKALRSTGRLGVFGVSVASDSGKLASLKLLGTALGMPFFHPLSLMNQNRAVFGVNMGHLWHETEKIRSWTNRLLQGVADGWLRPHVDKAFPFDHAGEAHAYLEARKNIGKVVLTP